MPGWHTRFWRRVKIAPGVSINFSKSGPSVSLGPRGAKVTVGRRGVRQTIGIPGTGFYATRQLGTPSQAATPTPTPEPEPDTAAALEPEAEAIGAESPTTEVGAEPSYGVAIVVGVLVAVALTIVGRPLSEAALAGGAALVAGLAYEALAHHHPSAAKLVAQVVVGLATAIAAVVGIILVALLAVGLGSFRSSSRSGRRRRTGW